MLHALATRRARRGVRGCRRPLEIHDGEAPTPAGELTRHGHGTHRGALAARIEPTPAPLQATLRRLGALVYQVG